LKYKERLRDNSYSAWHTLQHAVRYVHELIDLAESACEETADDFATKIAELIVS